MQDSERCEVCGSWDAECSADGPVRGCYCSRCLGYFYEELDENYKLLREENVNLKEENAKLKENIDWLKEQYQLLERRYMPDVP